VKCPHAGNEGRWSCPTGGSDGQVCPHEFTTIGATGSPRPPEPRRAGGASSPERSRSHPARVGQGATSDRWAIPGKKKRHDVTVESGTAPPPPVFQALPTVESIELTDAAGIYRVVLKEQGGEPKEALFTVSERAEGPVVAGTDWDIFWRWPGDAESLRSVVRQVMDFHRDSGDPKTPSP
jgi:hypothetical protein